MPRLNALQNNEVDNKTQTTFDNVQKKLGTVPNIMRTMANAPVVLDSYLGISGALSKGTLSPKLREQIALVVGETNGCDYCLAAHSTLGKMAGLDAEEINRNRRGFSSDAKSEAALTFARRILAERGHVSDADVEAVRSAGFDDAAIAEITAHVAMNIFTNYFNHVADTEIDFPEVEKLEAQPV